MAKDEGEGEKVRIKEKSNETKVRACRTRKLELLQKVKVNYYERDTSKLLICKLHGCRWQVTLQEILFSPRCGCTCEIGVLLLIGHLTLARTDHLLEQ